MIDIELHKLYALEIQHRVNRFYRLALHISMCFYLTSGRPGEDADTQSRRPNHPFPHPVKVNYIHVYIYVLLVLCC